VGPRDNEEKIEVKLMSNIAILHQISPEESKPQSWPYQVSHREPDHSLKAGNRTLFCAWYSGIRKQIPLEDTFAFFPSDPLECQPRIALFHVALTANHSY